MERTEFKKVVDGLGRESTNQVAARICFTDGESHITFTWTIEEGEETVSYSDVHAMHGSAKMVIPYSIVRGITPVFETVSFS